MMKNMIIAMLAAVGIFSAAEAEAKDVRYKQSGVTIEIRGGHCHGKRHHGWHKHPRHRHGHPRHWGHPRHRHGHRCRF